jgi:hypothetical protein
MKVLQIAGADDNRYRHLVSGKLVLYNLDRLEWAQIANFLHCHPSNVSRALQKI